MQTSPGTGGGEGIEPRLTARPVVLFLCTGNSARSQMAEGLLRAKAGDRFDAQSAGTDPAPLVHPLAIEVMAELSIDIRPHRPKSVSEFLGRLRAQHLIIVCDGANQRCPTIFPGILTRDFWPIEDPAAFRGPRETALARFRAARDEISRQLDEWVAQRPTPTTGAQPGRPDRAPAEPLI